MAVFLKKFYITLLIIYCGWLLLVWLWPFSPYLLCFDDAFYYFEIARNIAHGFGPTFDRINLTNGFHPLWLIICVPVYWFGFDGLTAVRTLLSVQLLLWLCVCWMVGQIISNIVSICLPRKESGQVSYREKDIFKTVIFLFAVMAGNPLFLRAFVNGLESTIYAVFYTMLLWQTIKMQGHFLSGTSHRWRLVVGSIGALCFLSRTDAILLLICLGCCCLLEALSLGLKSWGRLAELFFPSVVVFVLFILINYVTFGSPFQVSGEIKRIPLTPSRMGVLAFSLTLSCIITWLFKNLGKLPGHPDTQLKLPSDHNRSKFPCLKEFINKTWWFALFCCLIITYYTVMQAFPQLWYFGPVLLYSSLIFLYAVIDILSNAVRDDQCNQSVKPSLPKVKWILTLPLTLYVIVMNLYIADPRFLSICIANQTAGEWISKNLPQNAILGSWDAGVIAYFTSQKIINIDGVVNSIDYARALKEGTAGDLLKKQGITYLVNHGIMDNGEDNELKQLADKLFGKGISNYLRLEKAWPFTFRGSSNSFGPGIWSMAVFLYKIEK